MPKAAEDPLVSQAFDASKHADLARAVEQLSPQEAAFFLHRLEAALKKRKLQLTGYLVALGAWLVAMTLAIAYYGTHTGFVHWVFAVPFGVVGVILYGFGTWAERVGHAPPPAAPTTEPTKPAAPTKPAGPTT